MKANTEAEFQARLIANAQDLYAELHFIACCADNADAISAQDWKRVSKLLKLVRTGK